MTDINPNLDPHFSTQSQYKIHDIALSIALGLKVGLSVMQWKCPDDECGEWHCNCMMFMDAMEVRTTIGEGRV